MKKALWIATLAVATTLITSPGGWRADETAAKAFDRIKALAGEWQSKSPDGKTAHLNIQVIAGGHTVLEEYNQTSSHEKGMYTLYHLDGDRLMLTHYCVSNNQPRMEAKFSPDEPNAVHFEFLDATNMKSSKDPHMHRAAYFFVDDKHLRNSWTYMVDGVEKFTIATDWERVQ